MIRIPLAECKHGVLYRLDARNLSVGVFRMASRSFVGIREKFGRRYLDAELDYDVGAPNGTATPIQELCQCPIEDLRESVGSKTVTDEDGDTYQVLVSNDALFEWLESQTETKT